MFRFLMPLALALALPLPALAQGFPPQCIVARQCQGQDCADNPGVTLAFEATDTGLVAWDIEVPHERIVLTALPGDGPTSWVGRAPDLNAAILMTRITPDRAVISMHSDLGPEPFFTARLTCAAVQPLPTPPLTKQG